MTINTAIHTAHVGHEDARPRRRSGAGNVLEPGMIGFDFALAGTTLVTAIRLSGFHAGSVVRFGDPSDPATPAVTVTGPDQAVGFTPEDFANGVYLEPPADNDTDMTIFATADVVEINSGIRDTLTRSLRIETHASMGIDPASLPGGHAYPDAALTDGAAHRRIAAGNAAIEAGPGTVFPPVRPSGTGGENGSGTHAGPAAIAALSGGAGVENSMSRRNQPSPAAPQNHTGEDSEDLSITWSFPDSYEHVTEVIISIPLDRYGNPVGDLVYKGPARIR